LAKGARPEGSASAAPARDDPEERLDVGVGAGIAVPVHVGAVAGRAAVSRQTVEESRDIGVIAHVAVVVEVRAADWPTRMEAGRTWGVPRKEPMDSLKFAHQYTSRSPVAVLRFPKAAIGESTRSSREGESSLSRMPNLKTATFCDW